MRQRIWGSELCPQPSKQLLGIWLQAELDEQRDRCEQLQQDVLHLEQELGRSQGLTGPQQAEGGLAAVNARLTRQVMELSDNLTRY